MKTKPFHFRYVNEIIGGFVLLVIALLVLAVFVAGRAQGWFEDVYEVPIDFPPQGSLDLQIGSPVQILGTEVGRVEKIAIDEEGFMTGLITVKGDFYRFVRTDSRVIVKKKFGVAGDAFIEVTKGSGPELPAGAGLVASKDTDLNELLSELLSQVREAILPVIESYKNLAVEYTALASDLRNEQGALQKMLVNLEAVTAQLNNGEIKTAIDELNLILADVRGATHVLPSAAKTLGSEMEQVPGTVLMTQDALLEAGRLIEGIQRHWLIRNYIPQQEAAPMIPVFNIDMPAPEKTGPVENVSP